jgi:hypothetical protein
LAAGSFKAAQKTDAMNCRHLFFFAFLFLLAACNDDPVLQPGVAKSEEYFPLEIGRFVEYQVDSIVFDDAPGGNQKDTVSFQLREEIVSSNPSVSGDTLFYIHRFRRNQSDLPWLLTDVWTAYYSENNVLRGEENLIFRKMTFPLYKGLQWIATSYINPQTSVQIGTENLEPYEYWESMVLTIEDSARIGAFQFPSGQVMQVIQTDSDDDLTKRFVQESYVRGIGLALRIDTILDSRCIDLGEFEPCIGKAWTEHASKGYILSQVMINHN